jgi:protein-tyrosine kinase
MERIKLAIEKAKTEGSTAQAKLHPVPDAVRAPSLPAATTEPAQTENRPEAAAVHYQRTAVVQLDPAHLERNRVIAHQKTHVASWAFDVLRTQVLQKMDEHGWRTLAVTSPSMESGKTLVSINLAISIAQQAQRTALLVDFDLRRPSVAPVLGLNQPVSLNEVLAGGADVSQAMVSPGIERLVVLPTNRPMSHTSELLSSPRASNLIGELRQRYDDRIVVFDLPPVLAADDVMAVLPHIDCVLMIVGGGVSAKAEIEEAMNRVARANVIGVVLNKDTPPTQQAYY